MRHVSRWIAGPLLLAAAAVVASCSGIPLKHREAAELNRFEAYAGKPIDSFIWLTSYDGWEPIARNKLVVWTDINQAYLITVFRPCPDLMFADRIGLTSQADTVSAHFDFVRARGWKCMIDTIRPVDYRRMRRDQRAKRQAHAHS